MSGFAPISSASTPASDIADALRVRGVLTLSGPSARVFGGLPITHDVDQDELFGLAPHEPL